MRLYAAENIVVHADKSVSGQGGEMSEKLKPYIGLYSGTAFYAAIKGGTTNLSD